MRESASNKNPLTDSTLDKPCCFGLYTERDCVERDWTWVFVDLATVLLGGVVAVGSFGTWLQDPDRTTGGVTTWRIPALVAITIVAAPVCRLVQAAVFRCLQQCNCSQICRDINFMLGSFEGIPAMLCLTAIAGWIAAGPVLDLPTGGLSGEQQQTQGQISRAFGCILTVSLLLGGRIAIVRYFLWGVLKRAA